MARQTQTIPSGRPLLTLRLFGGRISARLDLRLATTCLVLLSIALVLGLVGLASGDFAVPLPDVVGALLGQAERRVQMVVVEWRLPRAGLAIVLGAALGTAGAIFQSLTRNPLGSPDIIGFDAGSFTGALVVITLLGSSYAMVAAGALAGGLLTALAVYLLAYRGGITGFRLILVGIGISAMLTSLNTWMMLRAKLEIAMAAAIWSAGSLSGMSLDRLVQSGAVVLILLVAAFAMARPLAQLELGDDTARALGLDLERNRLALLVLGVALTASVTATSGPIGFVALVAPQLARRLTGAPGTSLVASAAMGAVLLSAADFLAQRLLAPTQLPVGVVTVSLGGLYFIWLLIAEMRRQ